MGTGLFDSPPQPLTRHAPAVDEPAQDYRAVSGAAIAAGILAVLAPLAFIDWWLAAVPALGVVLAALALRDIARRPDLLTGRRLALVALVASAVLLAAGLTSRAVEYATELPPGFARLGYAELQPAVGEPPDAPPDSARAWDGRDVLLKGYIYPENQQTGIVQFVLVRDQGDCCFGGNPKITDRVLVRLADQAGIDFTPRLTKIAGRFRVLSAGAAGLTGGVLYRLDDAVVR